MILASVCVSCVCIIWQGGEKRREEKENNYFLGWIKGENTKSNMVLIMCFTKTEKIWPIYMRCSAISLSPVLSFSVLSLDRFWFAPLPPSFFFFKESTEEILDGDSL